MQIEIFKIGLDKAITKTSARTIKKEVLALAADKKQRDLAFCGALYRLRYLEVKDRSGSIPFWKFCGSTSWEHFCEGTLGINARKAAKYVSVFDKYCVQLDNVFDPEKHTLDIDKMISLMNVVNENNLDRVLSQAANMSNRNFKKLTGPSVPKGKRMVSFCYDGKSHMVKEKAFKLAEKRFPDKTAPELFIEICRSYK